jgi:hypothetical protein
MALRNIACRSKRAARDKKCGGMGLHIQMENGPPTGNYSAYSHIMRYSCFSNNKVVQKFQFPQAKRAAHTWLGRQPLKNSKRCSFRKIYSATSRVIKISPASSCNLRAD